MRRFGLLITAALLITATAAQAQEDSAALNDKVTRLERNLNFLQKQVYSNAGNAENGDGAALPNAGQIDVRLSQINEQIRQIRGMIEQNQFQNKQLAAEVKKLQADSDFRLRALEQKQAAADAPVAPAPATPTAAKPVAAKAPAAAPAATADAAETTAVTGEDFPNSNAHYAYALKLWNDKKYPESATSFTDFIQKYPNDPLVSNAYYWLGETYYARNDYTRAVESFRKGFEVAPDGQKAPDNLLKLALALHQIKRTSEACVVLSQVTTKYADSAPRTLKRAADARAGMQCK